MAQAWTLYPDKDALNLSVEVDSLKLADAMPRLMVAARQTAATVLHGLHGRRRAGIGETFWQYRHFISGEPARRVDWRRSARDIHLYVREREWEVAHTVWIWADRSRSMWFQSRLGQCPKVERGVILALALADILVKGGERAGLLGLTRPVASRNIIHVLGETLRSGHDDGPARIAIDPRAEAVLIGDFLNPVEETDAALTAIAARGARGHIIMIADPAEEVFPFSGRTEFHDPESSLRFIAGRAQDYRTAFTERLEAHREAIRARARALGWSFAIHRTDRPASEPLLALHARLGALDATGVA